jgi:CheY-like chemotaxis protein
VLARERANLVFVDFMMPGMSGAEMLASMTADPIQRGIPVVVMSSLPEATIAERCAGYAAFMSKPFRITQVVTLAERLTRNLN